MESAHGRDGVVARHQRRFAERFDDAAPARIHGMIDHRGERPALAVRIPFESADRGRRPRIGRIEGRGEAERYREYGPVSVDDVGREHDRNAETRLLHRDALNAVEVLRGILEGGHLESDALARELLR
jgi:hypothetical protein